MSSSWRGSNVRRPEGTAAGGGALDVDENPAYHGRDAATGSNRMTRGALSAAALAAVCLLLTASMGAASTTATDATSSAKLRGDLAALVAGRQALDRRIPGLIAGYQASEIPYFAVLSEPDDAAHQAKLTALGARVLRAYRSVNAFALASSPSVVQQVAALSWVKWMAPVEVVTALDHEVDQSKATTFDVGAPEQWDNGLTGSGVRIAVLDTGLDSTHQDLDDLDFRNWSNPLLNPPKVVESRNFVGGVCSPAGTTDGHGHGTHVAGIATGTGEGVPLESSDDGKYTGIAPGAELAVGKVLTDAGAGVNSDLVAAMEWAALPANDPSGCAVGANIVNMSIGSEARPTRLNSDSDVDFVSYVLDHLAVKYGTLFVAAVGNSGPFVGSALEAPGSSAQALSVAATAKDYDVNHDDTLSGDTCAGWQHPGSANNCSAGVGDQPPSIDSFSSRGPSGDVWLRPDIAAPGYNIVSAQASTGTALAGNDLDIGTRSDPLYATASGTSMATPATVGSAALVLQAYRRAYGSSNPSGSSGVTGLTAPAYALLRAALMNTAGSDLYEARWILTTGNSPPPLPCPPEIDPFSVFCSFKDIIISAAAGSLTLYEVRNGAADPYVGPLAEGAGKLNIGRAIAALRDGVVAYSAASGSGADAGTGHRDLQGSWQIGAIAAGSSQTQRFVLHSAPSAPNVTAGFTYDAGHHPSDSSGAIPASWITLPPSTSVPSGGDALANFTVTVPSTASAGTYTGAVLVLLSTGKVLRLPVFASVALHDTDPSVENTGLQARIDSAHDVFAKDNTTWPSAAGTPGTGANADWLVYPVELAADLGEARFSVYDAAAGDETYDLYLYDSRFDLITSTHPFVSAGVTDTNANNARGPSRYLSPQQLALSAPAGGRYYLAVNRAKIGGTTTGDFGAFVLKLDEIRRADVSLTIADSPDPVLVGQDLTYTLKIANGGPQGATDVVVIDPLPASAALVSATATQGSCTQTSTVTCRLGSVSSGASVTVTIKVRPTAEGTLTNQATVAAAETDPAPGNNTAAATTTVKSAGDLSVTQTDNPDPAHIGQSLTYTLVVGNTGSTATGVTLTDNLPKNAGFGSVATTQGTCAAKPEKRVVTCSLGNLAGGAAATVTIVVKPTTKGTITNVASVKAQSPVDPNTKNNSSSENTTVKP
jgi:uncharacterized repeat protein (TIGR01451 family)